MNEQSKFASSRYAKCQFPFLVLVLAFSSPSFAQSAQLVDNMKYKCNGETVIVTRCRHDSDMPGYAPTTPQNDYCAVQYPDRPLHNGFIIETVELRADVVQKLQACGALAGTTPARTGSAPLQSSSNSATADAYIKQAEPYFNSKDAARAIDPLTKAIAIGPSVTAYNDLGIAYTNLNQYANAAAAFEQAVKLDPNDGNIRLNLGFSYIKLQKYDSAVATLREALRLKPNSPDVANELGLALEDSKDYASAAAAYRLSTQLDPKFIAGYDNFAGICIRAKDWQDAFETYRQLQKIDQDEANELYMQITQAQLDTNKTPSLSDRAKACASLDAATLLSKANKGDQAAMKQLSDVYYAKKDAANGLAWEIRAAASNDHEIENDLGWKYENGGGGATKSVTEARKWYQKAAIQSDENAQLNLCKSYAAELNLDDGVLSGAGKDNPQATISALQGTKADIDAAFQWCTAGGDQGLYLAAWYAGVLNARGGQGHAADYAESYFWLVNGNLQAGAVFKQRVAARLASVQRAEIEKRVAAFRPSPMELLHDQMLKRAAQKQ